jgi:hypothetical protein
MFHPIDTGPFKLVVLRPTDSIKAHPQSRYSKPRRTYPMASNIKFLAAHRSLSTPQPTFGELGFAVSEAASWVEARLSPDVESPTRASPLGALATWASRCFA